MEYDIIFSGLPSFLTEDIDKQNKESKAACVTDCSDCIDSWDCQFDESTCSRDSCADCNDCSDCSDCDDVVVPTSISIASLTSTSSTITATCYVVTQWGGSGLYVQLRLNGSMSFNSSTFTMGAGDSRSVTVTATGLSPQTYYSVSVYLYSQNGQIVGDSSSIETKGEPPSRYGSMKIVEDGIAKNSVSVSFTAIPNATYYIVSYRLNIDGSQVVSGTTNNLSYTFTGLNAKTSYVLNYRGANDFGEGPYMPSGIEVTTLGEVIPWDWMKQNVNASAALTQRAYEAISHNGPTTNFSYEVWNDIVDKAEEVVKARNEDWVETYGTAKDAKVDPSDKTITAKKFNAVWWNMAQFVPTGILEKKNPGDIIEGNFFEKLTDAINASIPS